MAFRRKVYVCFLVFFLVFILVSITLSFFKHPDHGPTVEIVVSRYNEDLKWTLEEPFCRFTYVVYNKGVNDDFEKSRVTRVIDLENVGRNDHTYLYHIVHHYHRLADITVFLTGSVSIPTKKKKAAYILGYIKKYNNAVIVSESIYTKGPIEKSLYDFQMDRWCASDQQNHVSEGVSCELQKASLRPLGNWYQHVFHHTSMPEFINWGGIFSIHKHDILAYRRDRFVRLMEGLQVGPNPEEGHYVERSWSLIFDVKKTYLSDGYEEPDLLPAGVDF